MKIILNACITWWMMTWMSFLIESYMIQGLKDYNCVFQTKYDKPFSGLSSDTTFVFSDLPPISAQPCDSNAQFSYYPYQVQIFCP